MSRYCQRFFRLRVLLICALSACSLLFFGCASSMPDELTTTAPTQVPSEPAHAAAPSIPRVTGVAAKAGDHSVTISWNSIEGVDGYCIYKDNGTQFVFHKFSDKDSKSFSNLENGVEYQFAVAAYVIGPSGEEYGPLSEPVRVTPVNDTLKISNSALVMSSGETYQLYCRLYDEIQDMTWSSADSSVASVDETGRVTALSQGTTKITAARGSSTRTCTVVVDRTAPEPQADTASRYTRQQDNSFTNGGQSNRALLTFTGDLMALKAQMNAAKQEDGTYDFFPSFSLVSEYLHRSDLAVGNLEVTLSESFLYANEASKYMGISNCNTTPSYLDALKLAGFDYLTTANNHYCDAGPLGLVQTLDHLDRYGFMHNGTYRNADEDRVTVVEVNGIRLGILNYNQKTTNGKDTMLTEKQQKEMLGKFYRSRVPIHIEEAREKGAEFIIVCIHYGTQNTVAISETQASITQYLADCGADLIIGTHPHMLQKFDTVVSADGRVVPVAYSLGNFCSSMSELERNLYTVILQVELSRLEESIQIDHITYVPCCILDSTYAGAYVITPTDQPQGLTAEQITTLEAADETIRSTIGSLIEPAF